MLSAIRCYLLVLTLLCSFSCKKEILVKDEDFFVEETEHLSELGFETPAVGLNFIEIKWKPVINSHFKPVSYTLFLDDKKIIEGLSVTKYSFLKLNPGKEYKIKVLAISKGGKEQALEGKVSTLPDLKALDPVYYEEYLIYEHARFVGSTGLARLKDGGHLVSKLLSISNGADFKIITFRVNKFGHMIWYRLTAPEGKKNLEGGYFIALNNNEEEATVFAKDFAFKLSTDTGEPLLYKDFNTSELNSISTLHQLNGNEVVVGTNSGGLMSIKLSNLEVLWDKDMDIRNSPVLVINSYKDKLYFARSIPRPNSGSGDTYLYESNLKGENSNGVNLDISGVKLSLLIDNVGNIYLLTSLVSFYNNIICMKLDPSKKVLKNIKVSDGLSAVGAFFGNNGEIVAYGRRDGSGLNVWGGIYVFDQEFNIIRKRIYDEKQTNAFQAVTLNTDGSYNLFLHYAGTTNFTFIKTDLNGNMF